MPAVQEPPATPTAIPKPPLSFLDDPNVQKEWEDALIADGNLSSTAPKVEVPKPADAIAPVVPKPGEKPAEKPAEKPDEKPKDDDEIPGDIKSPAAQSSWKRLKESKKNIETERDAIRAERDKALGEIKALHEAAKTQVQKANLADDPEYQTLKKNFEAREKEATELSERLRLVEVEQHPKFQQYFRGKIDQQLTIAKELGGDKLVEALQLPPGAYQKEKLLELTAEMNPIDQATLGSVLTNLRIIESEKASEIAKAKESYQQLQAQEKAKGEGQMKEFRALFDRVTADVTHKDNGLSVFHKRDGDEEWNKGVDERLALAQGAFSGKLTPEDGMRMIYWGAAAPALLQQSKALASKVAELEKTITEMRAATPPAGGGGGEPPETKETYVPGIDGIMAEIEKILPGAR